MNALIHTIEQDRSGIKLQVRTGQLFQNLALAAVLVSGFAAAASLALLQTGIGVGEASRILATLAAVLGWIYLGLAVDEEHIGDALPDIVSFVLVTGFALLSLGGNMAFVAAAFGVHLVRALMRLATGAQSSGAQYGLLAWTGFTFGAVLVSFAGIV